MKHSRKKNKIPYYILIAIFALLCIFFVELRTHIFGHKLTKTTNNKIQAEISAPNNEITTTNQPDPSKTASSATQTTGHKIPIFMYHYIRVVTDKSDTIGINLSVTPEIFKKQLDLIAQKGYTPITFYDLDSNTLPSKPIILTFDDGYVDFYQNAFPVLKEKNFKAVSFDITSFRGGNYMSTDQLKEISTAGIEIGSHTIDHPDLSKATDAKALQEIQNSKADLEQITGKKLISFCYPSGKYTTSTVDLVKAQGFKYAVTTKSGIGDTTTPFELSRYRITNDTNIAKLLQ